MSAGIGDEGRTAVRPYKRKAVIGGGAAAVVRADRGCETHGFSSPY